MIIDAGKEVSYPNYPLRVFEHDNYWVCTFPDLPGCSGIGDTPREAVEDGLIAMELWLDAYHDMHGEYPPAKEG